MEAKNINYSNSNNPTDNQQNNDDDKKINKKFNNITQSSPLSSELLNNSNSTEQVTLELDLENNMKSFLLSVQDQSGKCLLNNEVLENTPKRFSKAFAELTSGYYINIKDLLLSAVFDSEGYDDIIIVDDIDFNSLCEHHLLPFTGVVSIGYIPNKSILGLSKFARLVEAYSRRLSLQERLTKEICDALDLHLKPRGVIVQIVSEHSCMSIRGVKSKNAKTKTLYSTGEFKTNNNTLNKYFSLKSI